MKTSLKIVGLLCGAVLAVGSAVAQESTNRVAKKTDWNVFVEESPTKQCWVVSAPTETVNTREGRVVAVNRGDIQVFVSYWPSENKMGEVSFTGGYPFGDGTTVSLQIGSGSFEMFTTGEMAWALPADDSRIISAMKRGSEAVLTGISAKGTTTKDTFSLLGFTAAIEEAENQCGT
ncbi:invasion associated locus B family protein [Litoreibacter roseus]|uniref:Invasion protein IalB, involved in pathogenesis n=1 Tax=Litoreibacter roseus TaxID=2601869 RepID=A0A6N6JDQ9_9RHOB|nr:invasion associated locus B family protein [Litoreibacter roseus]GFE64463.1 hypothetical protein KIN_15370 [Litoreibacter roseus]